MGTLQGAVSAVAQGSIPDRADDIARKLDNDWLDVFWSGFPARNNDEHPAEAADKRMARFFDFVARMLLPGPEITKGDLFSRVSAALSPGRQRLCAACDNLELVVRMLDTLHELILPKGKGIAPFFVELFSGASGDALPVPGKISLFNHGTADTNLLRLCCEGTLSSSDELMLFGRLMAAALHIPPDKEKRRLRILRNLLEYPFQDDGENPRLRRLLALHDLLACETVRDENGFNPWQVQEEKAKLALRQAHEDDAALQDALDYLEDHPESPCFPAQSRKRTPPLCLRGKASCGGRIFFVWPSGVGAFPTICCCAVC